MPQRLIPRLAVVGAVLVAAALGFWVFSGPTKAAMERRDDLRLSALRVIESRVDCIAHFQGGTVPQTITPNDNCLDLTAPTDPLSDQPYVFTRTGDKTYMLCAAFETDLTAFPDFMRLDFDPATGCFSYQLAD
jgi:hypothetical protein